MKNRYDLLTVISFLLAAPFFANAQCGNGATQPVCNPGIPNNAEVITGDQQRTGNMDCFWVCSGDSLFMTGANSQVYAESGAYIRILGGENYVWLHDLATCVIDAGSNTNWIRHRPNVTVIDNGALTADTICDNLVFNYSSAPASGCSPTGIHHLGMEDASIYPNPTNGRLNIRLTGNSPAMLEILDLTGRIVLSGTVTDRAGQLDVEHLPKGTYMVRITVSGKDSGLSKLLVE